ncbi:deoxyribodipyrimidine photo-lyase [Psychrobacillus sp. FJAT-51614]|uniref:Deoxyribodipyrimidine photo-lyase n=1 Tax=Psychrobacillus mangrovi TaxID=3117745 RepID=A0ABU8F6P9_9BACI
MNTKKIIVWFRKDLRVHDNPALWEASQQGTVIPVFIWSKEEEKEYQASDSSLWWLHHSLLSFQQRIPLIIRVGNSLEVLQDLIHETQADAVFFNERYEPSIVNRDRKIITQLKAQYIEARTYNANLLYNPAEMFNHNQEVYKVFTTFWKKSMNVIAHHPVPTPYKFEIYKNPITSVKVEELHLLSSKYRSDKLEQYWKPGEQNALEIWEQFLSNNLYKYERKRDFPASRATSTLSPYLASGNISVRSIFYAARKDDSPILQSFIRQLVWREFSYHQLIQFPTFPMKPLRSNFEHFPWQKDEVAVDCWKKGLTGYPLVDAGMRELWETGYMHNRVRMVASSFLVKHLLIDWRIGYEWFQQTLVDFDVANNAMGWQWVTGSGIDSAPYFRIFNPIIQSEKFDSNGDYIRKWVPELAKLPAPYIHRPWDAPSDILKGIDIQLGSTYPLPIVDHSSARLRALRAYDVIKGIKKT